MDVSTLAVEMRRGLYQSLEQFEASGGLAQFQNGALLKQKLLSGGFLDEWDVYTLRVVAANGASDWDYQVFCRVFGEG